MTESRLVSDSGATSGGSRSAHGVSAISLERTMCYGCCPVYRVEFRSDGLALHVGEIFVEKLGPRPGRIDDAVFDRLASLVVRLGFFDLEPAYRLPVTDHPTHITTAVRDGVTKRVSNYAEAGPAELWAIEELIDATAEEIDWDADL